MSSEKTSDADNSKDKATTTVVTSNEKLDEAWEFLQAHHDPNNVFDAQALKRLRRKIDWSILPIFFFIFGLQFLDKYVLGYALIMGLPQELGLKGNEISSIASSLWIAYLIATPFCAYALNKVRVAKWLGCVMTLWGVVNTCVAAAQGYRTLLVIRILMGLLDASIPACLMLLTSQYYRKDEQATRFAWWFSSIGAATIIGGLISYGFQFVEHAALSSWRIMYLVLGLISVATGLWSLYALPDTPMDARFLTNAEKAAIIKHVSINETGLRNIEFKWSHLVDLVTDPQVYLLFTIVVVTSVSSGILSLYAPSLIKGFGYNSKESALLVTPTGAVGLFMTIAIAYAIRHGILHRWQAVTMGKCCAIVGASLLAYAPRDNIHAQLAGIYLFGFALPSPGVAYQWTAANMAGSTKRALATSLKSAATAIGQIAAPYAVKKQDAPQYLDAKITLLATQAVTAGFVILLALYYLLENKRRDRNYGQALGSDAESEIVASNDQTWANLTDRERKATFRYVY